MFSQPLLTGLLKPQATLRSTVWWRCRRNGILIKTQCAVGSTLSRYFKSAEPGLNYRTEWSGSFTPQHSSHLQEAKAWFYWQSALETRWIVLEEFFCFVGVIRDHTFSLVVLKSEYSQKLLVKITSMCKSTKYTEKNNPHLLSLSLNTEQAKASIV